MSSSTETTVQESHPSFSFILVPKNSHRSTIHRTWEMDSACDYLSVRCKDDEVREVVIMLLAVVEPVLDNSTARLLQKKFHQPAAQLTPLAAHEPRSIWIATLLRVSSRRTSTSIRRMKRSNVAQTELVSQKMTQRFV